MRITRRQLRRLIKEELSMLNEGLLPETPDEMMLKLETILGLNPSSRTYQMIKEWVDQEYASPEGFSSDVWDLIISGLGGGKVADAGRQLLDYIFTTGQT